MNDDNALPELENSAQDFYQKIIFNKFEVDYLFVVMGTLNEYFGGYKFNEDGITIGEFYGDKDKQTIFVKLCRHYLQAHNQVLDFEEIKENQKLSIKSKTLYQQIAENYSHSPYDWLGENLYFFPPTHLIFERFPIRTIKANALSQKISYLFGIFLINSNKENRNLHFYNAGHKADLAINIIKEFEAFGGSLKVEYHFNTPCVTVLQLNETNILFKNLEDFKRYIDNLSTI